MGVARDRANVELPPAAALELWLDTERWPMFVDGLARVERRSQGWPEPGSSLVWQSRPGGRGRVTVEVLELEPPSRVVVRVADETLSGTETAVFEPTDHGSVVDVALDYALNDGGPLKAVTDAIFIRRALRDSIRRTLGRFAVEAAEDAALPS